MFDESSILNELNECLKEVRMKGWVWLKWKGFIWNGEGLVGRGRVNVGMGKDRLEWDG